MLHFVGTAYLISHVYLGGGVGGLGFENILLMIMTCFLGESGGMPSQRIGFPEVDPSKRNCDLGVPI